MMSDLICRESLSQTIELILSNVCLSELYGIFCFSGNCFQRTGLYITAFVSHFLWRKIWAQGRLSVDRQSPLSSFGSFDWEREKGKVTKSGKTTTFCL